MRGHSTAYMDEVFCTWHSQLVSKECTQALLSQDCFAGELTPTVLAQKHLRQQAQHVIGPHITGRLQLTDTTFAAGAKQAAELCKGKLRKRLRLRAWAQKVPAKLRTGPLELMQVACAMHADMVKRAKGGAVVQALRAAHFLDWLPGEGGLVKVSQKDSLLWPAGGHRIDPLWSEPKEAWMEPVLNKAGQTVAKPLPCDWRKLNSLRRHNEKRKKKAAEEPQPGAEEPLPGLPKESLT